MNTIGDEFSGSLLVFATLKTNLKDSEKRLLRRLVTKNRKQGSLGRKFNPILILTGKELFGDYERGRSTLLELCDSSQKRHLNMDGWEHLHGARW